MKKALVAVGLLALVLPAGAIAAPTQTDSQNAAQECRAERGTTSATREAFNQRYGTNENKRNAFGKCVSTRARDEEDERDAAAENAAKACKDERQQLGPQAFSDKYGTNKNKRNAFGKCVSAKAKEQEEEADRQDAKASERRKKAAKQCGSERKDMGREAFADKYGTNKNKRNAFGKCVSARAKARS